MWWNVTSAQSVGTGEFFGSDRRTVYYCELECGHSTIVTTVAAPLKCDCMTCDGLMRQPALPMAMPRVQARGRV